MAASLATGVPLDGNLRRHAAHRVDTTPVTSLDQQLDIGLEEMPVHGDGGAVGKRQVLAITELLDEAEDVIPPAAVQSGRVVLQLKENLIHFKGRGQRLDEHRGANRAPGNAERILREVENAVPQARFAMALHLGQDKSKGLSHVP